MERFSNLDKNFKPRFHEIVAEKRLRNRAGNTPGHETIGMLLMHVLRKL